MKIMSTSAASLALLASLGGCAGLSQIQDATSKFDQGAKSVAVAQIEFDRAVRSVACRDQFVEQAAKYTAAGTNVGIDLAAPCTPIVMTDASLQLRQNLMNTIVLYADQIAALSGDDNKNLAAQEQQAAADLNALAKKHGLQNLGATPVVETAVIFLTDMILAAAKETDIRAAARAQQSNLEKIVDKLKEENKSLAEGIASNMGSLKATLTQEVAQLRHAKQEEYAAAEKLLGGKQSRPPTPDVFFTLLSASDIVHAADPFTAAAGSTAAAVTQLNHSLDLLLATNQALASSGSGGIMALVNELNTQATAAQQMLAVLSK